MGRRSERADGEWGGGLTCGLAIGITLGISMDNLGTGIAIGIGVSVAMSIAFAEDDKRLRKRRTTRDDQGS